MRTHETHLRIVMSGLACAVLLTTVGCPTLDDTVMDWAKHAGGDGSDRGYAIDALSDGSTIVTGQFSTSTTFGAGEANETTLNVAGSQDVPVAKYNPDGTLAWVTQAGGTGEDRAHGVATLPGGAALVAGYFTGTATFGAGETNQTVLTSAGGTDVFLAKFNPDGSLAWAVSAGGSGEDKALGVSAFTDGSSAVTGYFSGSARFDNAIAKATMLTSAGDHDIFVASYRPNGSLAWAVQAGGTGRDEGTGIAGLDGGACAVTGLFSDSATFGSVKAGITLTSAGATDIFVAQFASNGASNWAIGAGGTGIDEGTSIDLHPDGYYVVAGAFSTTAAFDGATSLTSAGAKDAFLAKYSSDSTLRWIRQAGGVDEDIAYCARALGDGGCVFSGSFRKVATFQTCEGGCGTPLTSRGNEDIFVMKYAADESMAWLKHLGGVDVDMGLAVTGLADGSCIATGRFRNVVVFGEGQPNQVSYTGLGCCDIFVTKYPS